MNASHQPMPYVVRTLGPALTFLMNSIQNVNITGTSFLPSNGPVIIAANHTSFLDPIVIGMPLFQRGITPRFAARADLFSAPVLGWLLRQAGQVPVHRRGDVSQLTVDANATIGLEDMHRVLDENGCLCIFPEGTFTHDPDGWAMRAKTGIARLILTHPEVPVIPVAHWGNERLIDPWTKHISWKMLGRRTTNVHVHCGEPLDFSAYQGREVTKKLLQEIADVIMNTINDELEKIRMHDRGSQGITRRDHLWDRRDDADGDPLVLFNKRYNARLHEQVSSRKKVEEKR